MKSISISKGIAAWETHKHADGSEINIDLRNGRIVRTQAPIYSKSGNRTNKGQRVDKNGNEIPRHIDHKDHPEEIMKGE